MGKKINLKHYAKCYGTIQPNPDIASPVVDLRLWPYEGSDISKYRITENFRSQTVMGAT